MEHSNEATAYHEAGHAVVALALGRPVDRVTIVPIKSAPGYANFVKELFGRPTTGWNARS